MTFLEAKKHLALKLDIDYDDIANNDLWSDTDFGVLIQLGAAKVWDYKPWPFTQKAKTATTDSTGASLGYYDQSDELVQGSVFLLRVGGKEFKKVEFQDFLKYLEDNPTGTARIWSEWETFVYINANAYTVGDDYDLFGKCFPPVLSATTDLLPFSPITDNNEYSGNEAIVQLAYAEALDSDKKNQPAQAETERKKAYQTLDVLWKPFADRKALMQSSGRPMSDVPDFFGQGQKKDPTFIGNFHYLN